MNILNILKNGFVRHKSGNSRLIKALSFQTRLISELQVTDDLPKTWRECIRNIVRSAADITEICFAFAVHWFDNAKPSLEIIWPCSPRQEMMKAAEALLISSLERESSPTLYDEVKASHTVLDEVCMPDTAVDVIELSIKRFSSKMLPSGFVGLGLRKSRIKDYADRVAVEGINSSLAGIICSLAAIRAYTLEIERFATRDPLTGLYNQVAFWDMLEYETERSRRHVYSFALLVMDLDNFKAVNDTYGHDLGDSLLKDMASLIKGAVRKGDIPARYGGDKFAAILPVCDEEQAHSVAGRIMDAVRRFSITLPDGTHIHQTFSIGISVFPYHAASARDLFLMAETMVVQAKASGKDRICSPSNQQAAVDLRHIGEKNIMILNAIERHAVVPYFQPIIGVKDGRVEAYEVLTRISTPERIISASEFVETAESMGAIAKLDYQLIEGAFELVKKTGYSGRLFLNLSPKALIISDFMPTVRKLLDSYHIEPSRMVFEITERDTVRNMRLIENFIKDLRLEGFRFAIDDFGAGYSSFQYIKTFSIDYIKIDGEFIRNMAEKGTVERAIVASVTSLAKGLGIKTIAEYVESADIMSEVDSVGIDYAQGYYISYPSPVLK